MKSLLPPEGIDFLFIDGDHTYAGAKSDYEMYSPLVRPGGLISFHDICLHPPEVNCQVDQLWAEIYKQHPSTQELIENPAQSWGGIGVVTI